MKRDFIIAALLSAIAAGCAYGLYFESRILSFEYPSCRAGYCEPHQ